MSYILACTFWW